MNQIRVIMGNIIAIYQKELQGYFASPLAYAIAGIFWLLCGVFFLLVLQSSIALGAESQLRGQPIDTAGILLQDFLGIIGFISLFVLPILSMGLYAEERKQGTLELLATSPITNWAVATGKLLGVLTFFVAMLLPTLVYLGVALGGAVPAMPPTLLLMGGLAAVLLAAAVLSLGMFVSSLTSSTVLAAILSFALVFSLWLLEAISRSVTGPLGDTLRHLSLLKHYANLVQGVVDTSSLLLFASYIFLGLFLTAQSIEALRFQRS